MTTIPPIINGYTPPTVGPAWPTTITTPFTASGPASAFPQTASASGLAGLLGRVPGITITNPEASGALGQLGFMGARTAFTKAIPGVAFAEIAPKVINAAPGLNQDQADILGNVAAGAGLGAAAGAPFEGVGAIPGAGIGATLGLAKGLYEYFGGEDKPKPAAAKDTLANMAASMGLNPDRYTGLLDVAVQSGQDTKTLATKIAQQIITDADSAKQLQAQTVAAQRQNASDQQFALALQAQAAQYFSPYIQNIVTGGEAQADALRGLAAQLPPQMRGIYEHQAASIAANAKSVAGAYAAQAASPTILLQQIQQQSLAAQQAQADIAYKTAQTNQANALAQYYLNGGGGGSQQFGQVLQQQGVG